MKEEINRGLFEMWVITNKLHTLLNKREIEIFLMNNMEFKDLKLFGKLVEANNLVKAYILKDVCDDLRGMANRLSHAYWIEDKLKCVYDFHPDSRWTIKDFHVIDEDNPIS